jgi:hypothetical protein
MGYDYGKEILAMNGDWPARTSTTGKRRFGRELTAVYDCLQRRENNDHPK